MYESAWCLVVGESSFSGTFSWEIHQGRAEEWVSLKLPGNSNATAGIIYT